MCMQHIYSEFIIVIAFYCAEFFNASYTIMHMYTYTIARNQNHPGAELFERRG